MIWTENFHQVPGGGYMEDVTFGDRTYKVYKNSSSRYIAFVATANFASGTLNLIEFMNWAIAKGCLAARSTLNQVCYGVEIVSTDDADATFQVTAFTLEAKLRPRPDRSASGGDATNQPAVSNVGPSAVQKTR